MNTIKYYTERGVSRTEFARVCGKLFPIRTETLYEEPYFRPVKDKYRIPPCISTTPQYQNALHLATETIDFDIPISHVEKIEDDGEFVVRPLSYSIRTAFTTFSDVKHMGYTLRDVIFPRPFSFSGRFEGVNNYPYPKPMGVNIILIDPENKLVLQKRTNLSFDANKVAATAAGAVEYHVVEKSKNPLEEIIKQELEEEVNYTGKINGLTYIGYIINYHHLLDISHVYIGWATEEIDENIKNSEVAQIIKIPLEKFENIEETVCTTVPKELISTTLAGAIDLINKIHNQ